MISLKQSDMTGPHHGRGTSNEDEGRLGSPPRGVWQKRRCSGRDTRRRGARSDVAGHTLVVIEVGQQMTARSRRESLNGSPGCSKRGRTVHRCPLLRAWRVGARQWAGPRPALEGQERVGLAVPR